MEKGSYVRICGMKTKEQERWRMAVQNRTGRETFKKSFGKFSKSSNKKHGITTPCHIILSRTAENQRQKEGLKADREKWHIIHRAILMWILADLSTDTMEAGKQWNSNFKVLKDKHISPTILQPATFFIKNEEKIYTHIIIKYINYKC